MKSVVAVLATLCASFALEGSAVAMIGETPKQFEPSKPVESKMLAGNVAMMTWVGKTVIHIGQFDNNNGGRCQREKFKFKDGHDMCTKPGELEKFLAPYEKLRSYDAGNDGQRGYFKMVNASGRLVGVVIYNYDTYWLDVMTASVWENGEMRDAEARIAAHRQRSNTPLSAPKPAVPAPTASDQNDCLPFAIEALARLKKSSHWAEIAGFTWIEDGKKIGGHAVVFYQPTEKTNVFMYDRSGSYDLQTRSHDLAEIIAALNQLTRDNLRVESPRWLESDDSKEEFASSESDRQPNWSSTAPTTREQTAEQITIVFLGILMWILMLAVSVICFLKGKPVFGTLGLFSGA